MLQSSRAALALVTAGFALLHCSQPDEEPAASGGASNAAGASNGGAERGGTSAGGTTTAGGKASGGNSSGGKAQGGNNATRGGATSDASGGTSAARGGSSTNEAGTGGESGGSIREDCKRGVAANTAPGAAFYPALGWWYNWAIKASGANVGVEFVPMIWGASTVNSALPAGAKYLLTFNEPNFHEQSNLTAQQAASHWPTIEQKANAAGIPIVGPGMNYCGPAANCNGTDPYQYYKDFFAACDDCRVDHIAVHWYNCDLPSLKDYLEPGGNLPGFEQFGKPIWLTEFSCDGKASVAEQEAYMRVAIPYLEANPHVFRYSWFSADPIPNAKIIQADGSPTALGRIYLGLDGNCTE